MAKKYIILTWQEYHKPWKTIELGILWDSLLLKAQVVETVGQYSKILHQQKVEPLITKLRLWSFKLHTYRKKLWFFSISNTFVLDFKNKIKSCQRCVKNVVFLIDSYTRFILTHIQCVKYISHVILAQWFQELTKFYHQSQSSVLKNWYNNSDFF